MRVFGVNLDPNMFLNRVFFVVVGVLQFGHTHTQLSWPSRSDKVQKIRAF